MNVFLDLLAAAFILAMAYFVWEISKLLSKRGDKRDESRWYSWSPGKDQKTGRGKPLVIVGGILVLMVLAMIGIFVSGPNTEDRLISPASTQPVSSNEGANYKPHTGNYVSAWAAARIQAEEQMFSPKSAKFYGVATDNVEYIGYEKTGDGWVYKFNVKAQVECQNAYGVVIRYTMYCEAQRRVDSRGEARWFVGEVIFL